MIARRWVCWWCFFFFLKQKRAYEIRPRDWSSDVCSSDLRRCTPAGRRTAPRRRRCRTARGRCWEVGRAAGRGRGENSGGGRSLKKKRRKDGLQVVELKHLPATETTSRLAAGSH